jgi:hypothetical protein
MLNMNREEEHFTGGDPSEQRNVVMSGTSPQDIRLNIHSLTRKPSQYPFRAG